MTQFEEMLAKVKSGEVNYSQLTTEQKSTYLRKLQEAHVSHIMPKLRSGEYTLKEIKGDYHSCK